MKDLFLYLFIHIKVSKHIRKEKQVILLEPLEAPSFTLR